MTKQDLYKSLCIEAGTFDGGNMTADEWYAASLHNITSGMDDDFELAASGHVQALIDARQSVGLPIFI